MSVAQKLYEGITLKGEGAVGLITYMRTDSVNIAKDALAECRKDRDTILHDIENVTAEELQDPTAWDEFAKARDQALQNKEDDHDLMIIAFQTDYCYYTEWEDSDCEDDFQYEE